LLSGLNAEGGLNNLRDLIYRVLKNGDCVHFVVQTAGGGQTVSFPKVRPFKS
jgi:hypothetical protein